MAAKVPELKAMMARLSTAKKQTPMKPSKNRPKTQADFGKKA